jgi:hypothetical protein
MPNVEGWIDWVSSPEPQRGTVWLGFFLEPWRHVGETRWQKGELVIAAPVASIAAGRRLEKVLRQGGSYRMKARAVSFGRMRVVGRPVLVDDVPEPGARPREVRKRRNGYEFVVTREMSARLAEAERRASQCEKARAAIVKVISKKLAPLYNRRWRGEGPALSAQAFARKVGRISELEVAPRATTVFFDAGGLFGDHAIEVRLTAAGKVSAVGLA